MQLGERKKGKRNLSTNRSVTRIISSIFLSFEYHVRKHHMTEETVIEKLP
jgi:hypothetical protein